MLADNSNQKIPTKVIKWAERADAVQHLAEGNGTVQQQKKIIEEKIAERRLTVLDMPVLKSDGFSSVIS